MLYSHLTQSLLDLLLMPTSIRNWIICLLKYSEGRFAPGQILYPIVAEIHHQCGTANRTGYGTEFGCRYGFCRRTVLWPTLPVAADGRRRYRAAVDRRRCAAARPSQGGGAVSEHWNLRRRARTAATLVVMAGLSVLSDSLISIETWKTLASELGRCSPIFATLVTVPVSVFSASASSPIVTC